ncbi:hypothetical protein D3C87_1479710 [compost metagenome]
MEVGENSFDVIRGLRVIYEAKHYPIRAEHRDGVVVFEDGTSRYFKIINGLCIPDDVSKLFNVHGIGQAIVARTKGARNLTFYSERNGFC